MRYLALLLVMISPVLAHDHDPALDTWYKSLRSEAGSFCCDGSDAFSVLDPDWDTTGDPEWPYKVKLQDVYVKVHYTSVVKGLNRAGIAKVWPVFEMQIGAVVRCFLPGSLT